MGDFATATLVAAAVVLAGCGTPASSSVSNSSQAPLATANSSVPTGTALTFPPSQTPIEPGIYRWDGFEPSITIALGPGWALGHHNAAFFDLFRGSDFPSVTFGRFTDVYVDGTTRVPAVDAETVAATLMGRTDMTVTVLSDDELGGHAGRRFDLVTLAPRTPLFFGPAGDFKLDPEFKTRYRVLDFPGGGVLVIGIHTRQAGFDDGVTLAEPIVETVIIER